MPKNVIIIFIEVLLALFFSGGELLASLTPDSERVLGPLPMFPCSSGVLKEII
jgi:hypothetical protein